MNDTYLQLGKTYLQSNAAGISNGHLKATGHRQLCEVFISEKLGVSVRNVDTLFFNGESIKSHVRKSTLPLTDYLDEVIGFPLDVAPNYKRLTPVFVAKFLKLANDWYDDQVFLMSDAELKTILELITKNKFSNAFAALESYGFEFCDGVGDGDLDKRFLTMESKLGQIVTIKPNEFFGCKFTIDKTLTDER